eukprot:scaffold1501_cov130-Cylindrotheca_fusiformis.AAC.9
MEETIAIFGATGDTGSEILDQALKQGKKVRVMVRSPSKLAVKEHANLVVVEGDCFASDAKSNIEKTIRGSDYVICCVNGPKGKPKEFPVGKILQFVKEVIEIMEKLQSAKVFLFQSGAFVAHPDGTHPFTMKFMKKVVGEWMVGIGPNMQECADVQDYFYEMRDELKTKFIISRPGGLKKGKGGKKIVARKNPPMGMVTFTDLATFTLEAVKDESIHNSFPYVGPEE